MQNEPNAAAPMPTPESNGASKAQPSKRPLGVFVVAGVLAAEALTLAVLAAVSIVQAFSAPMHSLASGVFLIILLLGLAAGLAAVSVNAFKGMRWTRSAAFVWQLLMVAVATPAVLDGNTWVGLLILVPAVAAAFFLFTPKVVAFSQRSNSSSPVL